MYIFMEFVFSLRFFVFITIFLTVSVSGHDAISVEEFRILQDKIRNMESRLEKAENRNYHLSTKLQNTENKLNALTAKCNFTDSHLANKRLLMEGTSQTTTNNPPAFSTRLTHGLTGLGTHQTIIYDKVVTDTSSAYNVKDGIYVTPQTGMYVFTWTTAVHSYIDTELVVDDVMYGYAYADTANDGDYDYGTASQTVVIKVNKGQHVWIRRVAGEHLIDGRAKDTTFSGWLLYPME